MTRRLKLGELSTGELVCLTCATITHAEDVARIVDLSVDELLHQRGQRWCAHCEERFISRVAEARHGSHDDTLAAVELIQAAEDLASRNADLAGELRARDAWRHLLGVTVACFACGGAGQVPDDLDDLHDCFSCRGEGFRSRPAAPRHDLTGAQVAMDWQGRRLLGDVLRDGGATLTVRHFNGDLWPVHPRRGEVTVLR